MSLVTEVGDLTAAVNLLIEEVDVKKTALDEAVGDAETAEAAAEAAQAAAESAQAAAEAAVASLVQITVVSVLNSAAEIPDPPASNTLYLIRA
jgi:uncharacterized protein YoxC